MSVLILPVKENTIFFQYLSKDNIDRDRNTVSHNDNDTRFKGVVRFTLRLLEPHVTAVANHQRVSWMASERVWML
jgi:hypothetical protein